jgi:hypothetical protein
MGLTLYVDGNLVSKSNGYYAKNLIKILGADKYICNAGRRLERKTKPYRLTLP